MKKIMMFFLLSIVILTGCDKNEMKTIEVSVYNNIEQELFSQEIKTDKENLLEVLKDIDVKLVYKDDVYGAYITSMMDIDEKSESEGIYYWAYYEDNELALQGVSNCDIKDGSEYKFVYEYYKY